ncbi:MAG: hypothetical protein IK093_15045 [Ruminiclostridium sp.]|nr:hypothetical protein [Ruminiclostridium sp.]
MKKAVIVMLILLVLGIVGYFIYKDITVKEITYVSDVENNKGDGKYSVKRLYSSDIDIEAFNEKVEKLLMLEFSEEDVLTAALEAGTPQFYPAFHILTYRPTKKEDKIYMELSAVQEIAPGQKEADYCMDNLKLEVMTTGISIEEAEAVGTDSLNRTVNEAILKNDEGTGMMVELNDYGNVKMTFDGLTGSIVLQYTYDIKKNSLIPKKAVEGCMVMIRVNVITNDEGETEVTYQLEPISTTDEYLEQE